MPRARRTQAVSTCLYGIFQKAKATLFFENIITSSVPDLGGRASPTLCPDTLEKCPNMFNVRNARLG